VIHALRTHGSVAMRASRTRRAASENRGCNVDCRYPDDESTPAPGDVAETRKVSFDGMERRRLNNHYITRDFDPGSRTKPFSHTFTVIDRDPL